MISKFLIKLKSILFKSPKASETPLKKVKKANKTIKKNKSPKTKSKKGDSKKNIEILTTIPGVGIKSAKAFYDAGFKTKKAIINADEKDLLAVQGVGINLVKKIKSLES